LGKKPRTEDFGRLKSTSYVPGGTMGLRKIRMELTTLLTAF